MALDDREIGWLLPDNFEPVTLDKSWVAPLPLLDPTVMGWRRRGLYLAGHGPQLFDTTGNAGTTARPVGSGRLRSGGSR